ncbi:MAG: Gfo/Idh/MocA family oxidoreductase, partial [Pseudomonadota bacterium]
MTDNEPSIGLIGLGYWGKNILRNLVELGALRLACDMDKAVLEERRKTYPDAAYTTSVDDVLRDPAVRAVVIASSAATHFDLVKQALEAGKDVMVEKPLALTAAEGEELIALAGQKERILMVGHILQYHPAVIKLKALVAQGELGKIQYIYSNRLNIGKLRTEENILW